MWCRSPHRATCPAARRLLCTTALLAALAGTTWTAFAQNTPVGLWLTLDEDSGEAKSLVRIAPSDGTLVGHVVEVLDPQARATEVCQACRDDRHNQPIQGMRIISQVGVQPVHQTWTGGRILDPENGKEYRLSLEPLDGGRKLRVKGHLGPFWRSQTWVRQGP